MHRIYHRLAALAVIVLPGSLLAQTHVFEVALDGKQEVPANSSTATGQASIVLDETTGALSVRGTYTGLGSNRTAQHVHEAGAGANGAVLFALAATGLTAGSFDGSSTLTATQVATLISGGMYINIHSTGFPGGEIRGQILPCPLYYKFDRGLGEVAVNYGSIWNHGEISAAPTTFDPWTPGRSGFGQSLRGSDNSLSTEFNYCDTGWPGGVDGDLSICFWMKQRVAPGTALSYVFGGIGSWRCFTNGVAGTSLWMRNWGGADLQYPGDIQALAARPQGVCVALTIDATALQAQWYADGLATGSPITIANGANIARSTTTNFTIGKHTSDTNSSAFDLDEFRICTRVASAAEVRAWCAVASAGTGTIGKPCGITNRTTGGTPTVGNGLYTQLLEGPAGMNYLFVLGGLRMAPFDMGIAFAGLGGCDFYSQFDVQIGGSAPSGDVEIPTAVPNDTSLIGVQVDTQVLGFDANGKALLSNALSHAIERD